MKQLKKLFQFGWQGVHPHQLMPPMRAWIKDFAKQGSTLSFLGVTYEAGTGSFWIIEEEYQRQGLRFYQKVEKDPGILFRILKKVEEAADEIFEIGKVWNFRELAKLSTKELLVLQKHLFEAAERLWRHGQPQNLVELHNSYLSSKVKAIITARFGAKRQIEVFTSLTTGFYDSLLERQDRDFFPLLHATQAVAETKLRQHSAMIAHFKKYAYMTYGWEGPAQSLDYFVANLLEVRKNKRISAAIKAKLSDRKNLRAKQLSFLKRLGQEERKLVELLRTLVDSKAKRIDAHSQTYFLGDKLFMELGKRRGFSVGQLRTIDPLEFGKRYLKASADELNADYKLTVWWWEKGQAVVKYNGKKAERLMSKLKAGLPKVKKVKELAGDMAYPGKARGRARIVLYAQNFQGFQAGDILITKITDPSYVPMMKKAAAVVTDIGGITCHAAIVARELRKPCLIGTKIATKVFKDGDLVEVDAVKGIVRKLKK